MPNSQKGIQNIFSHSFAGRCVPRLCCVKQHNLFNLHTFRPYYFSQFSEKSGCFTSGQRADILASWYIFRYQLKKGNTGGHGASQGQETCGERAEGNNSRINSSVCLKMMAGFYLHRFVPGSRAVHVKITARFLMESSGLPAVVRLGVIYQNVMDPGKLFTVVSENGLTTEFLIISFEF